MRALVCVALIALVAAPLVRAADPPEADSPQAKRERFMDGGDLPAPASTAHTQSSSDTKLPADTSTPAPTSGLLEGEWMDSLEALPDGGWKVLIVGHPDNDAMVLYFSTHRITVEKDRVTAWFRWEYQSDLTGPPTFRSVVTRDEFDCTRAAEIHLSITYYSQQNMEGTQTSQMDDPKTAQWIPVIPGTLADVQLNWACDKVLKTAQQRKAR